MARPLRGWNDHINGGSVSSRRRKNSVSIWYFRAKYIDIQINCILSTECCFPQYFQEAVSKSGRSPPDPHVPPFAYYELGVLYAKDEKVSHVISKCAVLKRLSHVPVCRSLLIPAHCGHLWW